MPTSIGDLEDTSSGPEEAEAVSLGGFRSYYLHRHLLADVFNKDSRICFRRNKLSQPGLPGELTKEGHQKIFTYELAKDAGLSLREGKAVVNKRLQEYYMGDPGNRIPPVLLSILETLELWKASCADDLTLQSQVLLYDPDEEDVCFPSKLVILFYRWSKAGSLPTTDRFLVCGKEFSVAELNSRLSDVDTAAEDTMDDGTILHRRTPACVLRLFLILIVDDIFYERLLTESRATPNQPSIDAGEVGDNTVFWKDVAKSFLDDTYAVPKVPVNNPVFREPNGVVYDTSKCFSKFATSGILRKWYMEAHNRLSGYKDNYDRSGQHEFGLEHINDFVQNFTHGNKDAAFLSVLVAWRGTDSSDIIAWISGELPGTTAMVDGMNPSVPKTITTSTGKRKSPESQADSVSLGRQTDLAMVKYIEKLATTRDSPQKAKYYDEKAMLVHTKAADTKRDAALKFAASLRQEAKACEAKQSQKDRKLAKAYRNGADKVTKQFLNQGLSEFINSSIENELAQVDGGDDTSHTDSSNE